MKKLLLGLLIVTIFLSCLILLAPAWLLEKPMAERLPTNVVVSPLDGRLWQGRAPRIDIDGIELRDLNWSLSPARIFSEAPVEFSIASPLRLSGKVGVADGAGVLLHNVEAVGQAASLLQAIGMPSMGFDASYRLNVAEILMSERGCERASGQIDFASLAGDLAGIDAIGEVSANLSCVNKQLVIRINEDNNIRARGVIRAAMGGRVSGNVLLSPKPGTELYKGLAEILGAPRNKKDFILRL